MTEKLHSDEVICDFKSNLVALVLTEAGMFDSSNFALKLFKYTAQNN